MAAIAPTTNNIRPIYAKLKFFWLKINNSIPKNPSTAIITAARPRNITYIIVPTVDIVLIKRINGRY